MICAAKEDLVGSIKVDGPLDGVFVVGTTRASLPAVWRAKSRACQSRNVRPDRARRDNLTLSPGGPAVDCQTLEVGQRGAPRLDLV